MSASTRFNVLLIALTGAMIFPLSMRLGLSFPQRDWLMPAAIISGLATFAEFYRRRDNAPFVTILSALMQLVAYTTCFTTLMYAVAATGRPLADESLMRIDAACGVHLPTIVQWAQQHPVIRGGLRWAYDSMLPQTALVIAVLGFAGQLRELRGFVRQFLLCSWLVLAVFAVFPAAGPFSGYGYEPSTDQLRYLDHFQALRAGTRTIVSWRDAEGLITFPSFHTAWAILLTFAVRRMRWLLPWSLVLNTAVIVSTLTTGWHYFADVASGMAVASLAIVASRSLENLFDTNLARMWTADRIENPEFEPNPLTGWQPATVSAK